MNAIFAVFLKELIDTFRDRRTMMVSLVMGPLLMPALMMGMYTLIGAQATERAEKRLELPVAGAEHAPNLVQWLKGRGVDIKAAPADPERAVREQDEDVVVRIPAGFGEDWRASKPALVEIIHDASREQPRVTVRRVEGLLESYSRQVGALRLVARGTHPAVAQPLAVAHRDVSTPEGRMGTLLAFLPYLLILSGFLGGAHIAMDSTAGERERQSLEPLLATPAARAAIMSGKVLAASAFGLAMMALTLVAFKIGFGLLPSDKIGFKLELSTLALLKIFAVLLPMVLLGSAVLTALSATAKSYKEAQSYMTLLMLVPMLPSIILMVSPVKTQLWMLAVPFLSQNQLITKIARAETIDPLQWAVALAAAFAVALIVWFIAARMYHREQLAISA
jgi:sodium transport system permease protein